MLCIIAAIAKRSITTSEDVQSKSGSSVNLPVMHKLLRTKEAISRMALAEASAGHPDEFHTLTRE
jgi:hypothetical protein